MELKIEMKRVNNINNRHKIILFTRHKLKNIDWWIQSVKIHFEYWCLFFI